MSNQTDAGRGRTVHGASVGIIVLDTQFQRLPGDIANALTWEFPVQFHIVRGVTPQRVIGGDPDDYLPPFFKAIDELVALGVDGIATSCGFLAATQDRLTAYSPVPVAATSLVQVPWVLTVIPASKTVGVITTDKARLTDDHFLGVRAPLGLPVAELPEHGVIRPNMRNGARQVSYAEQEAEVLEVVRGLLAEHPNVGALVQECANLGPYSHRIEEEFGLPVYDVVTLVNWLQAGLRPRRFPPR